MQVKRGNLYHYCMQPLINIRFFGDLLGLRSKVDFVVAVGFWDRK